MKKRDSAPEEETPRDPRRDALGRFRPGVSGNPNGPKRGVPSFLVCLRAELAKATESGQTRLEAFCESLVSRAIAGDPASMQLVLRRIAPEALSISLTEPSLFDEQNTHPDVLALREWMCPTHVPAPEDENDEEGDDEEEPEAEAPRFAVVQRPDPRGGWTQTVVDILARPVPDETAIAEPTAQADTTPNGDAAAAERPPSSEPAPPAPPEVRRDVDEFEL